MLIIIIITVFLRIRSHFGAALREAQGATHAALIHAGRSMARTTDYSSPTSLAAVRNCGCRCMVEDIAATRFEKMLAENILSAEWEQTWLCSCQLGLPMRVGSKWPRRMLPVLRRLVGR